MSGHRSCVVFALAASALLSCLGRDARAVIVAGAYATTSDATVNITPPADDPGFYNVGEYGDASAIYLGNGWVLTASHIQGSTTTLTFPDPTIPGKLDTGTYAPVSNSGVILKNTVGLQVGTSSDLFMFKIDTTSSSVGAPNLPNLILSSSTPAPGATVVGIGRGVDRSATQTFWDNSSPTWQTTTQALASHTGYITAGPQVMRWGDNQVADVNQTVGLGGTGSSTKYVQAFTTQFDQNLPSAGGTALTSEFQVTNGDSGGAVFEKVGSQWMLAGMIEGVVPVGGQPYPNSNQQFTAAFGETSIIADMSAYISQILALDPVPGDANGDGVVNGLDINLIASHWLTAGPAGDVNGDGVVNGLDINFVASHWTGLSSGGGGSGGAAVPEPASGVLCALGVLCLWGARRFWRR
jgi:Dockerin type I domain